MEYVARPTPVIVDGTPGIPATVAAHPLPAAAALTTHTVTAVVIGIVTQVGAVTRFCCGDSVWHIRLRHRDLAASALSILNFRIKGLEFGAGVIDFKLPIDSALFRIAGRGPRSSFRGELLSIAEPAVV